MLKSAIFSLADKKSDQLHGFRIKLNDGKLIQKSEMHGFNMLAFLSWVAFTGMAGLYVFVMTTKLIIMLLEFPKNIRIEYVPDLESNK